MYRLLFFIVLLVSCGADRETKNTRGEYQLANRLQQLQQQVDDLSLLASSFTEGINSTFSDCDTVSNVLEKKMCQIAQTFNVQQQLEIKSQLGTMAKEFQKALFGEDCINTTDAGCPIVGSIADKISGLETTIASHTTSIASIQSTLSSLETSVSMLNGRVTVLENRFSNFNGSGQTIEVFVSAIKTDVTTLQTQVAAMQAILANNRLLSMYSICGDNPDSGPIYEAIAITGDKTTAYGYVRKGNKEGMGSFFKAGDANAYLTTSINSKTCKFKMYNDPTATKIQACWLNNNRSATAAQIDAARTAATATCTPY
jgi:CII-binding regulator of phage lambda lysogenization HflD